MKWFSKVFTPKKVRTLPLDTGGEQARRDAEFNLAKIREETAYYEGLGQESRRLRDRNGVADHIRATLRGA